MPWSTPRLPNATDQKQRSGLAVTPRLPPVVHISELDVSRTAGFGRVSYVATGMGHGWSPCAAHMAGSRRRCHVVIYVSRMSASSLERPTIRDIAEVVGVSVATVSRVLNNGPGVSDETRAVVLAAMERHSFTRWRRPRRTAARTAGLIAVRCPYAL